MSTVSPIIEISKKIANDDAEVIKKASECATDTQKYFEDNKQQYEERGIYDMEEEDQDMLCWLGMVDILDNSGYVCERDYKDELEDFIYFVGALKGVKENALPIEEDWFDEEDDISVWSEILDEKWESEGFCLAAIDTCSDSYVLFPTKISELEQLSMLAEKFGFKIDYAKNA